MHIIYLLFLLYHIILGFENQHTTKRHISTKKELSKQNYYQILSLDEKDTNETEISINYRKLALKLHPDKLSNLELSESKKKSLLDHWLRVQLAYDILSNKVTRIRYRYLLSQGIIDYDSNRDWSQFDQEHDLARKTYIIPPKSSKTEPEISNEEDNPFIVLFICLVVAFLPICYILWRCIFYFKETLKIKQYTNNIRTTSDQYKKQIETQEYYDLEQEKHEEKIREEWVRQVNEFRENQINDDSIDLVDQSLNPQSESSKDQLIEDETKLLTLSILNDRDLLYDYCILYIDLLIGTIFSCSLCHKKYKTSQQLENHLQSKMHKSNLRSNKIKQL